MADEITSMPDHFLDSAFETLVYEPDRQEREIGARLQRLMIEADRAAEPVPGVDSDRPPESGP